MVPIEVSLRGYMQPYADLRREADRYVAGLRNSRDPTICPQCFRDFGLSLIPNQSQLLRLRAEFHMLFDSCLSVILTWFRLHSEEDLRRILAQNCHRCIVPAHRSSSLNLAVLPRAIYSTAYLIVILALDKGDNAPNKRACSNKNFSDRLGRWPSCVSQLFPLGEQETVSALLAFSETYTYSEPLSILAELVILTRSIVWPILAAEPNRRRLLFIIVTLLNPPPGAGSPRGLFDNETVASVTNFLTNIRIGPDSRSYELVQLVRNDSDAAMLYYAVASALDKLPESSKAVTELALWCHLLYTAVPERIERPSVRALRWAEEHMEETQPSLGLSMHSTVCRLSRTRACIFCGISSIRQQDGKALSFCAGCKLVLYCSKSCQKQHWHGRCGRTPHKAACAILRRLDDVDASIGEKRDEFIDAFEKLESGLTAEELEVLREWLCDTQSALGDGFQSVDPASRIPEP
ncbi:hypothetical protein AURDEDRAFT_172723 [Auricularia subglabra TFB-10046 SS5]|nr:hypothetical protein AURDEDRAFT_172723 [Auricularia subglabra TFB-10046 SS5]